jgi:nucleoside-triphosphatase THEP1
MAQLIILTGWRGAGKTSLCRQIVNQARVRRWDIAGVISPARFEQEQKIGIEVEDLRSGQTRLLARRRASKESAVCTETWDFDADVLAWGNTCLANAVPCKLLLIDELGPLEFEMGQGWLAGLEVLDGQRYQIAIVVIRPELFDKACARWANALTFNIDTPRDIPYILDKIFHLLEKIDGAI